MIKFEVGKSYRLVKNCEGNNPLILMMTNGRGGFFDRDAGAVLKCVRVSDGTEGCIPGSFILEDEEGMQAYHPENDAKFIRENGFELEVEEVKND